MSTTTDSKPAPESGAVTSCQYLTFRLAEEVFAIPILSVQEIRGWERVTGVPRAPDSILGVISLRGAVVPVVSLRRRLGLPAAEVTSTTVVIVVRVPCSTGGDTPIGCVVDAVSDVVSFEAASRGELPETCGSIERTFVEHVAHVQDQMVMILDLVRLVGEHAQAPPREAVA